MRPASKQARAYKGPTPLEGRLLRGIYPILCAVRFFFCSCAVAPILFAARVTRATGFCPCPCLPVLDCGKLPRLFSASQRRRESAAPRSMTAELRPWPRQRSCVDQSTHTHAAHRQGTREAPSRLGHRLVGKYHARYACVNMKR